MTVRAWWIASLGIGCVVVGLSGAEPPANAVPVLPQKVREKHASRWVQWAPKIESKVTPEREAAEIARIRTAAKVKGKGLGLTPAVEGLQVRGGPFVLEDFKSGWFDRGRRRARFDQQAIEAEGLVQAAPALASLPAPGGPLLPSRPARTLEAHGRRLVGCSVLPNPAPPRSPKSEKSEVASSKSVAQRPPRPTPNAAEK